MPKKHLETLAIRHRLKPTSYREHSSPLFLNSGFTFDTAEQAQALFNDEVEGNIYSRFSNPNTQELAEKLCLLEGTEDGLVTATGMAAIFLSFMAFLKQGDHLLASRSVFGSTHQIITQMLPNWGIEYTYADLSDKKSWQQGIRPNTRVLFVESPSNPGLDLVDLAFVSSLANEHGCLLNVDNCFATPFLQRPADFGAHIITHSATKFIDGQGRVLGGAVLGSKEHMAQARFFSRHTGPALSPFNAWVLSKSLETLSVRMQAHCKHALHIAKHFEHHPKLNWLKYPHLPSHPQYALAKQQMKLGGALLCFEIKGGLTQSARFLDNLKLISHSSNLGDTRSIITHPASTTHSKLSVEEKKLVGITEGLIRLCVGLEHPEDLIVDIEQALQA